MHQFRLQFLQACLGFLALCKVTDEPGEETPVAGFHLADTKLKRES